MGLREENLNVVLAGLLEEKGLRALGEVILRKGGRKQEPDVLILLNGVRIVIEGKKPGKWDELVQQFQDRLDSNVCDLCVMVEYVSIGTGNLLLTQSDVKRALLDGRFNIGFLSYIDRASLAKWLGVPSKPEQYTDVGFDDLLTYLMSTYSRVVREDIVEPAVKRMDEVLGEFATSLSTEVNVSRLKEVLEIGEKEGEEDAE